MRAMGSAIGGAVLAAAVWPAAAASAVDYGPISHKGLRTVGAASKSLKLPLQIGFVANQSGLQSAVKSASNPASSSYGSYWVLAVGGTSLTLATDNSIASSGAWNDTAYPPPFASAAGGGGGTSAFEKKPWWQPAQSFSSSGRRMVPDVAAFADASPGYPIVCSNGVQGCKGSGQSIAFVGGTSAAAPLVAGMIALWKQQASNQGLPRPGFVAPLLYTLAQHNPQAFLDITQGTNSLFGGSCCPSRAGYDLATGSGSPAAGVVASSLVR